jgi:ComF family protein
MCPVCAIEPAGFDSVWSYGSYDGALRRLIHLYKYDRVDTLAGPLARLLLDALPRDEEDFDLIAPMPLHWLKRWSRGFNQSELLAREVSRRCGIAYQDVLRRVKGSPAQAGLTFAARRDNVRGVFRIAAAHGLKRPLDGKHVLLVDDVLTTGATVSAAARVLKRQGGARRISVLTLARADRRCAWRRNAWTSASAGD